VEVPAMSEGDQQCQLPVEVRTGGCFCCAP
jgi:hypothetical protein